MSENDPGSGGGQIVRSRSAGHLGSCGCCDVAEARIEDAAQLSSLRASDRDRAATYALMLGELEEMLDNYVKMPPPSDDRAHHKGERKHNRR